VQSWGLVHFSDLPWVDYDPTPMNAPVVDEAILAIFG